MTTLRTFAKIRPAVAAMALFLAAGDLARAGGAAASPSSESRRDEGGLRRRFTGVAFITRSSQAVLAYLRHPGKEALAEALKVCLANRAERPGDVFNEFLLAFCYHEAGDPAREQKALEGQGPERKSIYKFIFYEHRAELPDALYYLPAYLCKRLRETTHAAFFFPPGTLCPAYGGPISSEKYARGKRNLKHFKCAKCDAMLDARENKFYGSSLLAHKMNDLTPIVVQIASGEFDARRLGSSSAGAMAAFLSSLGVKEGQTVADIGSGIGYLTFPLAERVGPRGKVYAEDIDSNIVDMLRYSVKEGGAGNVVPVLGEPTDMKLPPASLDAAVLFHTYGDILVWLDDQEPAAREKFLNDFFSSVSRSLKDDGVFILVDTLDPDFDYTAAGTAKALEVRGFRLVGRRDGPAERHVALFFKKAAKAAAKDAAAR